MVKKLAKSFQPVTFERASIIRKFTVHFLIMSLIPTCILFYYYTEVQNRGSLQFSVMELNLTLTFVILGVLLGFFSMRAILMQLVDLSNANRKIVEDPCRHHLQISYS